MIFQTLLEEALEIFEGIKYIKYQDQNGIRRKTKIFTNSTPEKFLELIQYAVDYRTTLAGIYVTDNDDFILFERTEIDHTDVIGELELYDLILISFYIIPRFYENPNQFGGGWYLSVSGWSSSMRAHEGLELLMKNETIKNIKELAEQMGYPYCP